MKKSILLVCVLTGLMSTSGMAGEIKILKVLKSSELGERAPQSVKSTRCGEAVRKQVVADETAAQQVKETDAKSAR